MKYNFSKLNNNLKILCVPLNNFESATVTVWVKTGSRNETTKTSGISHFLEHMAFKGGKKYKTFKEVTETVDGFGGQFNAGTSKEWTQYYIRARNQSLDIAFDVLGDMLLSPTLRQSDIAKEKGVIVEEINMYEDSPMQRIWDLYEQLIFSGHQLGKDTTGTKSTVTSLSRLDFVKHMESNYLAQNMLITVVGGVTKLEVEKLSRKYFGKLKQGKVLETDKFKSTQKSPNLFVKSKSIEQGHFIIGFPGNKLGHKNRYTESVMAAILGGGMSSRLFSEVREKRGLAYAVRSHVEHFIDTGYFSAYAGVDPKKAEEAIKVILDLFYGLASGKHRIKPKELTKAKEYIKGHVALSLEDTRAITGFVGNEYLMLGKTRKVEQVYKGVDKVTEAQIRAYAKSIFDPKKVNFAIIGPYKSKRKFEKIIN